MEGGKGGSGVGWSISRGKKQARRDSGKEMVERRLRREGREGGGGTLARPAHHQGGKVKNGSSSSHRRIFWRWV
jgi:hypothetical protein